MPSRGCGGRGTVDAVTTARRLHYSYADYLRALEMSPIKLEYCDGEIYAMAGGTIAHAALSANATAVLHRLLKGCAVYSSDLKVRIEATDLSTFPDVSVVCGELERSPIDDNAVINPTILVEVTSRSTEDYDRGDKLSHYKQLRSLQAVLLVSHRSRCVTVVRRKGKAWEEHDVRAGEVVQLKSPRLRFDVNELYTGVSLEPR